MSICPPGLDYCRGEKKERREKLEEATRAKDEAKAKQTAANEARNIAAEKDKREAAISREAVNQEAADLMAKTMREFHGTRRRAKKNSISGVYDEVCSTRFLLKTTKKKNAGSLGYSDINTI